MQIALELYREANGNYPITTESLEDLIVSDLSDYIKSITLPSFISSGADVYYQNPGPSNIKCGSEIGNSYYIIIDKDGVEGITLPLEKTSGGVGRAGQSSNNNYCVAIR